MKKLVAFMLCCMMMVGALSAFAEDGVMPCWDCDHQYGTYEVEQDPIEVDECKTKYVVKVYCSECDRCIDSYATYDYHHTWVDEIIDGKPAKACYYCGKVK